ncbi:MAG: Hsp20/alpha crystallin family protein [Halobacteria archaeon]|nr:Hsp20/alpha crystallin family protein [Halobacteria archaeon]
MLLTRHEPYNLFNQFNNEVNRLFANPQRRTAAEHAGWMPAVDIREDEERYVLTADLPGIDRKDVEITVNDGVLSFKGQRTTVSEEVQDNYRRRERTQGEFLRQFTLPETADVENISASARDGVLEIVIPKQTRPQPQKITVN